MPGADRLGATVFVQQCGAWQVPQPVGDGGSGDPPTPGPRPHRPKQLPRVLPAARTPQVQLPAGRAGHGRQLLRVDPTDGKIHRRVASNVAVRSQLHPLPAQPMAKDGGVSALRQSY